MQRLENLKSYQIGLIKGLLYKHKKVLYNLKKENVEYNKW